MRGPQVRFCERPGGAIPRAYSTGKSSCRSERLAVGGLAVRVSARVGTANLLNNTGHCIDSGRASDTIPIAKEKDAKRRHPPDTFSKARPAAHAERDGPRTLYLRRLRERPTP